MRFLLRSVPVLLITTDILGAFNAISAQQPTINAVDYKPTCLSCRIEMTPVATLKGTKDFDLGRMSNVARDSKGRLFALADDMHRIVVFDSLGRHLQVIGGKGSGPGELPSPGHYLAVAPGDTLYVFTRTGVTLLFTPSLQPARQAILAVNTIGMAVPIGAGRLLVSGVIRTADAFGYPYHIMREDKALGRFEIERSLGDMRLTDLVDAPADAAETIGALPAPFVLDPDGTSFWIAPRWRVRRYAFDGRELAAFDVKGSPRMPTPRYVAKENRVGRRYYAAEGPRGTTGPAGIDGNGMLWLWSSHNASGDPTAKPALATEVFDPRASTVSVVQSTTHTPLFLSRELAYSFEEDADGIRYFRIWRVHLVRA